MLAWQRNPLPQLGDMAASRSLGLPPLSVSQWSVSRGRNLVKLGPMLELNGGAGLSLRTRGVLGSGHGREERVGVSGTRVGAYREEDWAKLFKPEAVKKEELKEYLNDDPIWLWVFKSWRSGINGALQFLWSQPGHIKFIEWPSVKSTVKMALLTFVIVMLLMVFLYSVDSLFRHLLKSSMRPMA